MSSLRIGSYVCALCLTAWAQTPPAGTVNFAEGNVTADGKPAVAEESSPPAHVLQTADGRAEVLLTPGIFLRVGENSTVRLNESSGNDVRVELVHGEALVEVARVDPQRHVDVMDNGADARLDHNGIFFFNANDVGVAVYAGRLRVEDDKRVFHFGKGERLALSGENAFKPRKFDPAETNQLLAWSAARADYDVQASEWTAEALPVLGDSSEFKNGWYWNPWYKAWAFVPSKEYRVSPYNYGFYPPNLPHSLTPIFGDFR